MQPSSTAHGRPGAARAAVGDLHAFEAAIAQGRPIEPQDWMPDAYRTTLLWQIAQQAQHVAGGVRVDGQWATRAPTLRHRALLLARVQARAAHGLHLAATAETLGADRSDLSSVPTHPALDRPEFGFADVGVVGWLVDGAALLLLAALRHSSYGPLARAAVHICRTETHQRRRSYELLTTMTRGTARQRAMVQQAVDRWWWPALQLPGRWGDAESPHDAAQSAAWGTGRPSSDETRRRLVEATLPQAERLGVSLPGGPPQRPRSARAAPAGGAPRDGTDGCLDLADQQDSGGRYRALAEPLYGVDASIPEDVDCEALAAVCLALGDDALVTAHRLAELLPATPSPEHTVALAGIALDLLGQARLLLSRSGQLDGTARTEDDLAYGRDMAGFRSVLLCEAPNEDLAFGMGRLLVLTLWRTVLFEALVDAADPVLAAVAAMGLRELAGHADYAAQRVIRLGDGTEASRRRMGTVLRTVGRHLDELCRASTGRGVDPSALRAELQDRLAPVLSAARPTEADGTPGFTEDLGEQRAYLEDLLNELQGFARAHPGACW